MTWQEFLTEKVLKECYHEGSSLLNAGYHCHKCDKAFSVNRTFDNRSDLMDLYAKVYKDGKWESFEEYQFNYWDDLFPFQKEHKVGFVPWLFCLKGECYTLGCKAVAEFYGWEEQRDPVIDKNSGAYGDN